MNKEYLKTFIDANEELSLETISKLKGYRGKAEDLDVLIRLYREVSSQQIAAIKQLNDAEIAEENAVIEYEKINVANENFVAQQKQELEIEVMNASRELITQLISMGFFARTLTRCFVFETDGVVSSSIVRCIVQKLPDFMKSRK